MDSTDWRRVFVGRDDEFEEFCAAWKKIAPADGTSPEPQCIVLIGESGLGKTRLVQEFYRWLSKTQDPPNSQSKEGYWPDAFITNGESLDVNPTFCDETGRRGCIPWLWWGIRFERPFQRNQLSSRCGLIDYRSQLMAHVEPIANARNSKKLASGFFWKAASVAATIGGTAAGPLGMATGAAIGTIAGLAFTAKDIFSFGGDAERQIQLDHNSTRSVGAHVSAEKGDLEDEILDYFRTILNVHNPEAKTVPVVLFLDDAQWADPITLRFLSRLLREAKEGNWPLLVVCTHWEREWNESLTEPSEDNDYPLTLRVALESADATSSIVRVVTLPPIPDLSDVARAAFPGLTDDQTNELLLKAGGNPLLLEEIILFLNRRPHYFEGADVCRSLNEGGLHCLRLEKTQLESLIEDRFQSLPDDVRQVLGWCSAQGTSFLVAITQAVTQRIQPAMQEDQLRSTLRSADSPFAFIQLMGHAESFNCAAFRQTAFYKVAHEHLTFHAEELTEVKQVIRDTVTAWILADRNRQLPFDEAITLLQIAQGALSAAADEPAEMRRAWGRMMMQFAMFYQTIGLWSLASTISAEWARNYDVLPDDLECIALQIAVIDVLKDTRQVQLAESVLRHLFDTLSTACAATPSESNLRDLSIATLRLGDIARHTLRFEEAKTWYSELSSIVTEVQAIFGDSAEHIADIACAHLKLSELAHELADWNSVSHECKMVCTICEAASKRFTPTVSLLRMHAVGLNQFGFIHQMNGALGQAREFYTRAVAIGMKVMRESKFTVDCMEDAIVSVTRLADVERDSGKLEAARVAYSRALELCDLVIQTTGETPSTAHNKSVCMLNAGLLSLMLGDRESAAKFAKDGLALVTRVNAQFGVSRDGLRDLYVFEKLLGDAAQSSGHQESSKTAYRNALTAVEQSIATYGRSVESAMDLSRALFDIGKVTDNADERSGYFERAIIESEAAVLASHDDPEALHVLALAIGDASECELFNGSSERASLLANRCSQIFETLRTRLGDGPRTLEYCVIGLSHKWNYAFQMGQTNSALEIAADAIALCLRINTEFEATPDSCRNVGLFLQRIGHIELQRGNLDLAIDAHKQEIESYKQVKELFGETAQSLTDLAGALVAVGNLEALQGKPTSAKKYFESSLELHERVVANYGNSIDNQRFLTMSLDQLGDLALSEQNLEDAFPYCMRSLKIREDIVGSSGKSRRSLRELTLSQSRVGEILLKSGHLKQAEVLLKACLEIRLFIVSEFGQLPETMSDLASAQIWAGKLELSKGNYNDAVMLFKESAITDEKSLELFGESPQRLHEISASLNLVALAEVASGQLNDALVTYEKSIAICELSAGKFGATYQSQIDIAYARCGACECSKQLKDMAAATTHADVALEAIKTILENGQPTFELVELQRLLAPFV